MQRIVVAMCTIACLLMVRRSSLGEVTVEEIDRGVRVEIDGALFTEYLTKAGQAPALWPIVGPTGKEMTRAWPIRQLAPGESGTDDHPHHQSAWFTHDRVNGVDFWKANINEDAGAGGPHIAHREFKDVASDGDTARITTVNDWMNGQERIYQDERTLVFGTRANGDRWIDFSITISALDRDVMFGDTKEGTFAVRVADAMRVDAGLGGQIVNSDGLVDGDAWGKRARWVDYTGPVEQASQEQPKLPADGDQPRAAAQGPILGIAIMSHPSSFRPIPRWHVRTYGLFTANPFGEHEFPQPDKAKQGGVTIKKGDSLKLRYRMLLHQGPTDSDRLNRAFKEFARD